MRTVVFFLRPEVAAGFVEAVADRAALRDLADIVVVATANVAAGDIPVHTVDAAGVADAFGMRVPRDGGFPVGYAIVDSDGLVRYRTLDPDMAAELGEVETILRATR